LRREVRPTRPARRTCHRTSLRSQAPPRMSGRRTRSSPRTARRSGLPGTAHPHTRDTHPRLAAASASIRHTGSRTFRCAALASSPTCAVHNRHKSARGRPRPPRSRGWVARANPPPAEVRRREREPLPRQRIQARKSFWPTRGSSRSRCS